MRRRPATSELQPGVREQAPAAVLRNPLLAVGPIRAPAGNRAAGDRAADDPAAGWPGAGWRLAGNRAVGNPERLRWNLAAAGSRSAIQRAAAGREAGWAAPESTNSRAGARAGIRSTDQEHRQRTSSAPPAVRRTCRQSSGARPYRKLIQLLSAMAWATEKHSANSPSAGLFAHRRWYAIMTTRGTQPRAVGVLPLIWSIDWISFFTRCSAVVFEVSAVDFCLVAVLISSSNVMVCGRSWRELSWRTSVPHAPLPPNFNYPKGSLIPRSGTGGCPSHHSSALGRRGCNRRSVATGVVVAGGQ